MLGLFRRPHLQGVGSRGRVVLSLERLEVRDQPNAVPAIVNFSANEIGNGTFLINGQVVDQNPGGLVVAFGGVSSANGLTVVTNADGTFSDIVQLQVNGTDVGFLTATTVDAQGLVSTPVEVFLDPIPASPGTNAAPTVVNFSEEQIGNGLFLISGRVVDQNPGGLVVTFSGDTSANGTTVVTNADGTFSDTVQLQGGGTGAGFLTAMTIDANGLVSTPVALFLDPTPVANAAPVIIDFEAEQIGNGLFLISGQVVDQNPGGLVVTFGGGTSASGTTVTTTPDGTFSCTIQLEVDGTGAGTLTATTVDAQGLVSAEVQVFLNPTPP
jgi:hypothetical protein